MFTLTLPSNRLFQPKDLYRMIWPLLLEQLLNVLIGMIDVLMVSSLGESAISGVSLVDSLNFLVFQVMFALCSGGNVVISRSVGAKDKKTAGSTSAQLMALSVAAMTLLSVLVVAAKRPVFTLLFGTVEQSVFDNAQTYMWITALSYPALALYNSSAASFRAAGDTKTPLLCSTIMNIMNVAGNALCIYVLKMGVAGVALPTLISRVFGSILLFYLLQTRSEIVRIHSLKDFRLDRKTVRSILSIGIPNGIETCVFQFGKLMLSSLVATLGTASIAGFAVAGNLVNYLYLPGNALGAAMLTIVGQCLGAGDRKQAKSYAGLLVAINYILLIIICTVMLLIRKNLIGIYHLSDESSVYATGLLVSHVLSMVIWPVAFLAPHYFRAIGKATFTMIVALATMWIFRVGLAYLFVLYFHKNVLWIWYAMYIDWVVRFIVYLIAFKKQQ